ncbi:hypothetical protein HPB50_008602 [Hyalomma asiaticum]|uniref:Uncharacterized protein n=1 Tax=Hyalomma asiaticum TaxID=266040 RepID=A0ACB7SUE4_HYAAI|nr:hypothetical protein HPB50_008602 [Hyalomma asiaticum]
MALRLSSPALVLARGLLWEAQRGCLDSSWLLGSRREASTASLKERLTRDLVLPVPNGQLAGKQWGPDDGQPVLALHGWLDNAAVFEPLVPFLKAEFKVVALDLPGHGLSSHLPARGRYTLDSYVENVLSAVDHLKWDYFSILGHGMGAGIGYYLAALQPDRVPRLASVEGSFPAMCPSFEPVECADNRDSYTRQEVMDDLASRGHGGASAELLMTRGCRRVPGDRYVFTTDRRVRCTRPQGLYPGVFDRTLPRYRNNLMVLQRDCRLLDGARPHLDALEAIVRCLGAEECARFNYVVLESENTRATANPDTVARRVNDFMCS